MFRKYVGIILIICLPISAKALIITTSVGQYDLSSVAGEYMMVKDVLHDQVWWGNEALAHEFLGEAHYIDRMEYENLDLNQSAYFAFSESGEKGVLAWWEGTICPEDPERCRLISYVDGICLPESGRPCVWAVATLLRPISLDVSESSGLYFLILVLLIVFLRNTSFYYGYIGFLLGMTFLERRKYVSCCQHSQMPQCSTHTMLCACSMVSRSTGGSSA